MGSQVLIDPIYDPDKIGSIYMAPQAQNMAPSQGEIVAVGPRQKTLEVGFLVLVHYVDFSSRKIWRDSTGYEYIFYRDDEVVALLTSDAEVFPRMGNVIVLPSWDRSGPVQHNNIFTIDRVFDTPPPRFGTVLRTGEGVHSVKQGDVVALPKSGGYEMGVKDRVLYSLRETDILGILTNADKNDPVGSDSSRG